MKKSLVALAALALVGAASAQSSVTLFGVVDAAYANDRQGGVSKSFMTSSGNQSSQLGFKGVEDLGNGLKAGFWLEAQLNNDTGAGAGYNSTTTGTNANNGGLLFNRRSTVDVGGSFGAIRMGRDYTPTFWNHTVFDPFGTVGAGAGSNITGVGTNGLTFARTNNGFSYLYGIAPNGASHGLGSTGVYAQVTYATAENLSNAATGKAGQYEGARVGYANGPLNVALAYAESNSAATDATTYKETNLAGSYDLGVAKLMAMVGTNDSNVAATKQTYYRIAATIPLGNGYIPVSFNTVSQNNAASTGAEQLAIGYVYNLSKRTALYTTYSALNNKNGGAYTFLGGNGGDNPGFSGLPNVAGQNGRAYDIGVRTSF